MIGFLLGLAATNICSQVIANTATNQPIFSGFVSKKEQSRTEIYSETDQLNFIFFAVGYENEKELEQLTPETFYFYLVKKWNERHGNSYWVNLNECRQMNFKKMWEFWRFAESLRYT